MLINEVLDSKSIALSATENASNQIPYGASFLKLACRFFLFNFPSPFLTIVRKSVAIKSAI